MSDVARTEPIRLFLCGDVMTGRGIDQILPNPVDPRIDEPWIKSSADYVGLAERRNGPIPRRVGFDYIWGDVLARWRRSPPDVRIVNLETSVTLSDRMAPKGINYRMSPAHAGVLTAAGIDCCVLANNHILDWGREGLIETLATLHEAGVATAGAGRNLDEAQAPAVVEAPGKGRILVYALAAESSGAPSDWIAEPNLPGLHMTDLSHAAAKTLAGRIRAECRPGDVAVVSIHWGPNWGFHVPKRHEDFAHALFDLGGVSIVHGHSSHHPLGLELFEGRLALYGCGDFLNDYEGIGGREAYASDLVLGYTAEVNAGSSAVTGLQAAPFRVRKFRLENASAAEAETLARLLDRESARFGVGVRLKGPNLEFTRTRAMAVREANR